MNKEMNEAIRILNDHSLKVISSKTQIKNETIMVEDEILGSHYTIHKTGYVRRRCTGWGGYLNHYQLNPVKKVFCERWGGYNVERILFPGEYVKLAEIVVSVVTKRRKKYEKNKLYVPKFN